MMQGFICKFVQQKKLPICEKLCKSPYANTNPNLLFINQEYIFDKHTMLSASDVNCKIQYDPSFICKPGANVSILYLSINSLHFYILGSERKHDSDTSSIELIYCSYLFFFKHIHSHTLIRSKASDSVPGANSKLGFIKSSKQQAHLGAAAGKHAEATLCSQTSRHCLLSHEHYY